MAYTPLQVDALNPMKRRRWGQIQGAGQGWQEERKSLGTDSYTPERKQQAQDTAGYSPETAGALYGGRPPGPTTQPNTAPIMGVQQNQMTALTQPAWAGRAGTLQPFGGTQAVRRKPYQPYNQFRGW
jgi:hypothetical protein